MGFIKKRTRELYRDEAVAQESSFVGVTEKALEDHLNVARYGSFLLTDAIRPAYDVKVVPSAGWRADTYRDEETQFDVPVIMAAETKERLFDLFIALLDPLGDEVDVVIETSHDSDFGQHNDLYREHMELPILKSLLYDYEDLLVNDGCTGIAVLNPRVPMEIQFDEHKLLMMYGHDLEPFKRVLIENDNYPSKTIHFVNEAEHMHSSTDEYARQFDQLTYELGAEQE